MNERGDDVLFRERFELSFVGIVQLEGVVEWIEAGRTAPVWSVVANYRGLQFSLFSFLFVSVT